MKKIISIVLIIILSSLCGCGNNLEATYTRNRWRVDNEIDYNEEPQEIDILEYAQDAFNLHKGRDTMHLKYGLKWIRRIEDTLNDENDIDYSVHKVKQGGLLYQFYHPECSWYYVVKELSSSDFANIDAGSTPEEVLKIDPATQVYLNNLFSKESYMKDDEILFETSYHYLTDGCMHIYWHYKDGKPQVMGKVHFEDYMESSLRSPIRKYYSCKILDKDTLWYDPNQAEVESE